MIATWPVEDQKRAGSSSDRRRGHRGGEHAICSQWWKVIPKQA